MHTPAVAEDGLGPVAALDFCEEPEVPEGCTLLFVPFLMAIALSAAKQP